MDPPPPRSSKVSSAFTMFLSIPTATDAALQGMVAEAYPPYERGSIRDPVVIADHIVLGACHKHQDENSLKAAVRPWINDLMGDSTSYVRGGLGKDAKVDGLIEIDGLHPSIAEDKWVSMGNEMYQAALGAQKFTLADVHQTGERPPKRPKLEENPTREEKHKLPAMANTCIRLHTLTVVFMSQLEYPQRQWHYWPAARINLRPPETSSRSSPRHNLELAAFLGVLRMLLRRIVSDAKETKRLTAPVCSEVLTKKLVPLSDKPVTLIFDSDEHLRMGRNNPRVLPVYYDLDGCRHNLVAKLVPGHSYGVEAHSQSAEAGWAPKLYYHGPAFTSNQFGYDCGFDLVIMERLTGSRIPTPSHQPAVGEFKTFLKTHNIVHGDLCLSNMVFLPNGKLKVIDWDWAGKASSVRYPMRLNMSLERHPGVEACGLIEHHHDVYLLDLALRTMHIY
ncbi:hypothetical protein C8F01DRAFT_612566 [Mycena amicta]|nr:hypothetical protein C8F01DRAFT_612566 [Mycena amicta]